MKIPGPEPSNIIETKASIDAKKIRFEINRIQMPIGVEGEFGVIRHPGAALAVPLTENGEVIILRQYRFACSRRILEFPAGTLEIGESPLESIKRDSIPIEKVSISMEIHYFQKENLENFKLEIGFFSSLSKKVSNVPKYRKFIYSEIHLSEF